MIDMKGVYPLDKRFNLVRTSVHVYNRHARFPMVL